jgi:hypothetical protein
MHGGGLSMFHKDIKSESIFQFVFTNAITQSRKSGVTYVGSEWQMIYTNHPFLEGGTCT